MCANVEVSNKNHTTFDYGECYETAV